MTERINGSQRLRDKVAIVTGATGGIGRATASLFLQEGAKVMLVGRSVEKLDQTAKELDATDSVVQCQAEADDEDANAAMVAKTLAAFGRVDILFANAGTEGVLKPFYEQSQADFEAVLRTNVTGVWAAMKHCVGPMKERGGSMIATASILGTVGFAGGMPYVVSKHAVVGLVKSAALELAEFGIRVNAVAPGFIDNPMMRRVGEQAAPDDPQAVRDDLMSKVALKRYGTDKEVASLVLYLASDESSYTTGATYLIDGGYTTA